MLTDLQWKLSTVPADAHINILVNDALIQPHRDIKLHDRAACSVRVTEAGGRVCRHLNT